MCGGELVALGEQDIPPVVRKVGTYRDGFATVDGLDPIAFATSFILCNITISLNQCATSQIEPRWAISSGSLRWVRSRRLARARAFAFGVRRKSGLCEREKTRAGPWPGLVPH